jgi:hypothetical protein
MSVAYAIISTTFSSTDTCAVNPSFFINKVYFSKEKALQKLNHIIKEYVDEYEGDALYDSLGHKGRGNFRKEEVRQLSDREFRVYGLTWFIMETLVE